jgi:beta-glucanase (GH16 family)
MRRFLTTLLLALDACSRATPSPEPPVAPSTPSDTSLTLVWSDEFDGAANARPDTTKWRADVGDGCAFGACGWGNNEKEYYTDDRANVALDGNGQLAIVARVATEGSCYYGPCRYTSAKLTTRGLAYAAPGRVEARIKLPTGQGLWPAFWMLGQGHPTTPWPLCGELDIMENRGSQPDSTSSAVHGPNYSGGESFNRRTVLPAASRITEYHVYAIEWDAETIRFYVDGQSTFSVGRTTVQSRGQWVFGQSFYVILNLAVGGHFDGDPGTDAIFPATMLVDWVRVYKR